MAVNVSADLTNDQLGDFVRSTVVRSAVEVWHAGHALHLVRQRLKGTDGWLAWLDAYFPLSEATAYRWIAVYRKVPLADVEAGKNLAEVYRRIGSGRRRKAKDGSTSAPRVTLHQIMEAEPERREEVLKRALAKVGIRVKPIAVMKLLEAIEAEWLAELAADEAVAAEVVGAR